MTNSNLTYSGETNQALIALVDYGLGNLRSVEKALLSVGANVLRTSAAEEMLLADKIILPGVGAFGDGMLGLRRHELVSPLVNAYQQGKPILGICLGMQLFFESSAEAPQVQGLGFLQGSVKRFTDPSLKIPQTGWNQIIPERDNRLLSGLPPGSYAYFNHGYYCQPAHESDILAQTDYGFNFACVVGKNNLFGVQFHPEKSQSVGLQILKNFVELSI